MKFVIKKMKKRGKGIAKQGNIPIDFVLQNIHCFTEKDSEEEIGGVLCAIYKYEEEQKEKELQMQLRNEW